MPDLNPDKIAGTDWHALSQQDVASRLATGDQGLDDDEAQSRLDRFGANRLPEEDRPGLLRIFLRQFKDPLIYVLLIAGLVSLGLGNLNNAIFIFAVLAINSIIGTLQEGRAEASAAALQEMIRVDAQVWRDGRRQKVNSAELVPGDRIRVEAGTAVPADIRLVSARGLQLDESPLTGESTPVGKDAGQTLEKDAVVSERENMVFAGSTVLDGRGEGYVCATGETTEVGKIAESLAASEAQAPPLVLKLKSFTRRIALLVLAAVAVLSITQFMQGADPAQLFFLGVALAVSAIPAGLPIAITVAMAMATRRMAERHVIVRRLPAVEGLGSCTLIASDKTGTLTANKLTIRRLLPANGSGDCDANSDGDAEAAELEVSGEGYEPEGEITRDGESPDGALLEQAKCMALVGALCNEGELDVQDGQVETHGDSVDLAFLVLAAKLDLEREALLEKYPERDRISFHADRRFAATFNEVDDTVTAHVKGAAEVVLEMCGDCDVDALSEQEQALAERGYRVLALARGAVDQKDDEYEADDLHGLEFCGFAGLIDPIRSEVPEAVARCRKAGVDVRMITGDHPATGMAIARELGIADEDDQAVTGAELRELDADDDALSEKIAKARVFARVEPAQKTVIVESLQQAGELVAVTGDGVNDAPALKTAHIGVAMGEGGTDVARRAASLILTDDNFASLVAGIEQGRGAYDNVRKVIWLLLATGAAEVLLFFLALFAGLPLPLTAVQLLWLNLVTNGIQDVALAMEEVESDVLERKPRPPKEPIFNRRMIQETLLSGGYMGSVAFGLYFVMIQTFGMNEDDARNLLLLQMVLFENVHAFSCRSETASLFKIPLRDNPLLIVAVLAAQGVHILAMFIPGLNNVLGIEPVALESWAILVSIAVTLLLVDEVAKFLHRRAGGQRPVPALLA
ncbi:MAG: HAD-IC family P-type ATPase [Wenzhouxiangellaceae bacterium]|nr:HAD-IC family P-type ATPase [Wenzhouxiangellaceae bacterium]